MPPVPAATAMPPLASTLIRMPSTSIGSCSAAQQALGPVRGHRRGGQAGQQDGELVAAEPGDQVAGLRGRGLQPLGDLRAAPGRRRAWPRVSLTSLKWLRSISSSAVTPSVRWLARTWFGRGPAAARRLAQAGERVVGGVVRVLLGQPLQLGVRGGVADRRAQRRRRRCAACRSPGR